MQAQKLALLLLLPCLCAAEGLPLFADNETLDLTFEFPLNTIIRKADDRPVVEAKVHYTDETGAAVTVDMTMTTRGKSRLEYCKFPPLSANFKNQQRKGTLFEGQKKLKIGTLCRSGSSFERYLVQEYSIYRAFNVLTDQSFRVRLINATYRDSEGKKSDMVAKAYFIESEDELTDRLGMQKKDISIINPDQLEPQHASLFALFQYLVANTDWSTLKGPGDDSCCHNGKLVTPPGSNNGWLVIPYDFDQAGIINTKYSLPAEGLGIKSVRQRVYRGRCMHLDQLDATVALFNSRRKEIEDALVPEALAGKYGDASLRYIDEFYRVINDPLQREQRIENRCLGGGGD